MVNKYNGGGSGYVYYTGYKNGEKVFIKYGGIGESAKNEYTTLKALYTQNPQNFLKPYYYDYNNHHKLIITEFVNGISFADYLKSDNLNNEIKDNMLTETAKDIVNSKNFKNKKYDKMSSKTKRNNKLEKLELNTNIANTAKAGNKDNKRVINKIDNKLENLSLESNNNPLVTSTVNSISNMSNTSKKYQKYITKNVQNTDMNKKSGKTLVKYKTTKAIEMSAQLNKTKTKKKIEISSKTQNKTNADGNMNKVKYTYNDLKQLLKTNSKTTSKVNKYSYNFKAELKDKKINKFYNKHVNKIDKKEDEKMNTISTFKNNSCLNKGFNFEKFKKINLPTTRESTNNNLNHKTIQNHNSKFKIYFANYIIFI